MAKCTVCPQCSGPKGPNAKQCISCAYPRPNIAQPPDLNIRHIALTQGKVAIVDVADYEQLNQWRWCASRQGKSDKFYAVRRIYTDAVNSYSVMMHREILGLKGRREVDHANNDGLDNRRCNIRAATHSQNGMNKLDGKNTSGFKGVSRHRDGKKWQARICVNKKQIWIGLYDDPQLAHEAYKAKAVKLHGEFARCE